VHAPKIVVHKPERNSGSMILDLLGECICEPSEPTNAHSHRQILSLHERRRNVLRKNRFTVSQFGPVLRLN
jgi:hypothetical protein